MRQQTITKWVTNKDEEKFSFISEWNTTISVPKKTYWSKETPKTYWSKETPKTYWKKIIKIGYREVILYLSYTPNVVEHYEYYELEKYTSFLLSHLQKCIRRNNYKMAVHTAEILLEVSPIHLLRRLPIIMIEDSFIHYSIPTIVFLMCLASNGYRIEDTQKKWLLGVVYIIASCKYKEHVEPEKFQFSKKIKGIHTRKEEIQNILYSLETRKEYGGMKCDKKMIESYMNHYYSIDTIWNKVYNKKVIPIYRNSIQSSKNEWIQEAYDFHCSSFLLDNLEMEFSGYTKEEYKNMIWKNQSSIYYKRIVSYKNNIYIPLIQEYRYDYNPIWKHVRSYILKKANAYIYYMIQDIQLFFPNTVKL